MKTNKAKTSAKVEKKNAKQVVKKELEASITNKFLEALKSLGHDADKFSKDIKKTSKELAKKLAKKYNEVKVAVEEKLDGKSQAIKIKKIKRPISTSAKSMGAALKKSVPLKAKAVKKNTPGLAKPAAVKSEVSAVKKTTKAPVSSKESVSKPSAIKSAPAAVKKPSTAKPAVKKVKATVAPAKTDITKTEDTTSK